MDNWDEIRTAYQVARLGTVSGAADVLGVHHATVIRHIDALEKRLGVKLFQRHARGYTATEAGEDLLRVAQATHDQFQQLQARIHGHGTELGGELVLTSLSDLAPLLVPSLVQFQKLHPQILLRYETGARLFRLEYGEAHVAIRAGAAPEQPDNVVQPFFRQAFGLYAARSYAETHGLPGTPADFGAHHFIGATDDTTRAPFYRWLAGHVGPDAFCLSSSEARARELAVIEGAGIGFLPLLEAERHDDLIEVLPAMAEWEVPLWLVTHVDLHRTRKVQTVLDWLKDQARTWGRAPTR